MPTMTNDANKNTSSDWTTVSRKRRSPGGKAKVAPVDKSTGIVQKKLRSPPMITEDRLLAEGVLVYDNQLAGTNVCGIKMINNATQSVGLVTFEAAKACAAVLNELAHEDPHAHEAIETLKDSGPMMDDTGG